jgi:hypothetical protein
MTARFLVLLGVVLGLGVWAGLHFFQAEAQREPASCPVLSECDGAVRRLVIHLANADDESVVPTYCSFLPQLPDEVEVYVVCPSQEVFQSLIDRVGATACSLKPVIVDHPITSWSRDRWLALGDETGTLLLCPQSEEGADVWPARKGDGQVAFDLAEALGPNVAAKRSDFNFDGGDFAADSETVFARPSIDLRNVHHTAASRADLIESLSKLLKRRLVVLDGAPDHHVGMYMMPVGNRTVLVGDPRLAEKLLETSPDETAAVSAFFPGGPDFSAASAERFDAVADQCTAAGYRVMRIPVVSGSDGRTYITFVNGIQDERHGHKTMYMPACSFAGNLNRAAKAVWTDLGYEVREVQCDGCARNFGTLHCLVNVLRRDK